MDYLKDLGNTHGMMVVTIKVILSKGLEVVMDYGVLVNKMIVKNIKDIIRWIKNLGMVFINGKMDGLIKEISKTTIEMGMENYLMEIYVYTVVSGKMENNPNDRSR